MVGVRLTGVLKRNFGASQNVYTCTHGLCTMKHVCSFKIVKVITLCHVSLFEILLAFKKNAFRLKLIIRKIIVSECMLVNIHPFIQDIARVFLLKLNSVFHFDITSIFVLFS